MPMTTPISGEFHAAADDHADDVAALAPDRHAQADLLRALAHRVGHDAVESDSGEEQRDRREQLPSRSIENRRWATDSLTALASGVIANAGSVASMPRTA